MVSYAPKQIYMLDFRNGSKADIGGGHDNVCLGP